jgi:hypothetical protein
MPDELTLTANQQRSLRCLADTMVPASAKYRIPGAGDDTIFADILRSFGQDAHHVGDVLQTLERLCGGGVFADLPLDRRAAVAAQLREQGGTPLTMLSRIILLCYYRDDRVMRSLDMELRPPFPKGYEVEQGDWSLLDPVRQRAPFYRKVPAAR